MRVSTILISSFLTGAIFGAVGCKRKLSPDQVKDSLKQTMNDFLMEEQAKDSTHYKFDIIDVEYREEKDYYDCAFTVHLVREGGTDTTGVIKSTVAKDFSDVHTIHPRP